MPTISDLLAALTPDERARLDALLAPTLPKVAAAFGEWLAVARPKLRWDARHFRYMQAALDRVTAGTARRVYFQVPIRHGKTEHNTIGYAAYRLERDPTTRILVCSYNSRRAEKFSREIRRLTLARGVPLAKDKDGASEWETTAGGGVQAVGAGAGVASVNADLILIDDPIGSRDDAESPAVRDRVWDWLTNDILARCEPHTAVLLTMSRWHQDDPAGRLLDGQAGRWEVIDLPAEAEENDPLGRAVGEPLWPELRNAAWLAEKKAELGPYGFASLLQGRPRPRSGGMFKWADWGLLGEIPAAVPLVRYWDMAGTDDGGQDPDWTVGALLGRMADGKTFVADVARFRFAVARRDAEMIAVARSDVEKYGGRVRWWMEKETGIGGSDRTAILVRQIQNVGMSVSTEAATSNKVIRAEPLASAVAAGNVLLCPGEWRDALRAEAADFPTGKHDDQCLVGESLVTTPFGSRRLDRIRPGDVVLGQSGWVKVLVAAQTGYKCVDRYGPIIGTDNHPVWTQSGWRSTSQLGINDVVLMLCAKSPTATVRSSLVACAQCTTRGSTAGPNLDRPCLCGAYRSRLVRWQDVVTPPTLAGCAESTTRDGNATATRPSSRAPSGGVCEWSPSFSTGSPSGGIPMRGRRPTVCTSNPAGSTPSVGSSHYTARCGNIIVAPYQPGTKFTTSMRMHQTTTLETLSCELAPSTRPFTLVNEATAASHANNSTTWPASGRRRRSGTVHQRVESGIVSTPSGADLESGKVSVYNLATEDGTYFANGLLVHNCDALSGAFNKLVLNTGSGKPPATAARSETVMGSLPSDTFA